MKKNFSQVLAEILGSAHPLSYRQLQVLSNLGPEELAAFRQGWPAASQKRHRQIAQALVQVSEDNTDLNLRDVLLFCLDDPDEVVQAAAIDGLGDDESSELLERLLALAEKEGAPEVRSRAVLALGRFMYQIETTDLLRYYRQRLLQLLLDTYADPRAPLEVRRRALESMAYAAGSEPVETAIAQAYEAADGKMRASAIHAMGHHMGACWQLAIRSELESADAEMRYEAAYACGEMEDPALVPHLAPLVDDDDHEVAQAAIWALGEIGGVQARRLLQRCLTHEAEDIREAAAEALHMLQFYEDPMRML